MLEIKVGTNELKFYYTNEVADILGFTSKTVNRYVQEGKIKGKKYGRRWIIHEDDLKDFLSETTSTSVK